MGEAHTPHFYDVGICEPVVKPQNQLCLSLETPGYIKKSRKIFGTCFKCYSHLTLINRMF